MKDFDESSKIQFGTPDTEKTLELVRSALSHLWNEEKKSGLDKVAGPLNYEGLIGVLLHAEASELERLELEEELERVIEKHNATL